MKENRLHIIISDGEELLIPIKPEFKKGDFRQPYKNYRLNDYLSDLPYEIEYMYISVEHGDKAINQVFITSNVFFKELEVSFEAKNVLLNGEGTIIKKLKFSPSDNPKIKKIFIEDNGGYPCELEVPSSVKQLRCDNNTNILNFEEVVKRDIDLQMFNYEDRGVLGDMFMDLADSNSIIVETTITPNGVNINNDPNYITIDNDEIAIYRKGVEQELIPKKPSILKDK